MYSYISDHELPHCACPCSMLLICIPWTYANPAIRLLRSLLPSTHQQYAQTHIAHASSNSQMPSRNRRSRWSRTNRYGAETTPSR